MVNSLKRFGQVVSLNSKYFDQKHIDQCSYNFDSETTKKAESSDLTHSSPWGKESRFEELMAIRPNREYVIAKHVLDGPWPSFDKTRAV